MEIPVTYNGGIPENRDFLFEPDYVQDFGPASGVFAYIIDLGISIV